MIAGYMTHNCDDSTVKRAGPCTVAVDTTKYHGTPL